MDHGAYLSFLASAEVVIGQSTPVLGLSELEAIAVGAVVACPGTQMRGPAGKPPVLEGTVDEIVGQVLDCLGDEGATAARLDGAAWARSNHDAATWVPVLEKAYRAAAG
jgi:hypothetical protein